MDALLTDDITSARLTRPEEKLRQALELMEAGFRLQRAALRLKHPEANEEEIGCLFEAWLTAEDP